MTVVSYGLGLMSVRSSTAVGGVNPTSARYATMTRRFSCNMVGSHLCFSALRPMTMETRCCLKNFEFQIHPPSDFFTARYEHKSSKEKFQT